MKHIKRGYSWIFTRLAAIFGLTIGVQVATVHRADAYDCSSYSTYQVNNANFKYCKGMTKGTFCTDTSNCAKQSKERWYFFFTGCTSANYYSNGYAINDQITPAATSSHTSCQGNTTYGECGVYSPGDWGTESNAKAAVAELVRCTQCPPFGDKEASATSGAKAVTSCYMSTANNPYTDETGTFRWSSNCYYGN